MTTAIFQPSSKDTRIVSGADANTNYGSLTLLTTREESSNYRYRTLVEFAISWGVAIPASAVITAALLELYYYNWLDVDPVGKDIYTQRLLRLDWEELQATWNIYNTGNSWTTAGCGSDGNDYTSVDQATAVVPASYGWMDWDIKEQVKWAQTNKKNVAFKLYLSPSGTAATAYFYSREYAVDTTLRPKLTITYTALAPASVSLPAYGFDRYAIRNYRPQQAIAQELTRIGEAFQPQLPYGGDVLDFYLPSRRMAINISEQGEVAGISQIRKEILEASGLRVRFIGEKAAIDNARLSVQKAIGGY